MNPTIPPVQKGAAILLVAIADEPHSIPDETRYPFIPSQVRFNALHLDVPRLQAQLDVPLYLDCGQHARVDVYQKSGAAQPIWPYAESNSIYVRFDG